MIKIREKCFKILKVFKSIPSYASMFVIYKDLAMQNSHCNNGGLGLTYLTNLPRPYDLELFSQNLVPEVPYFEKLICTWDSWKGANFRHLSKPLNTI